MNPWILNTLDCEQIMTSWGKRFFDYPHVLVDPDRQSLCNRICDEALKPVMMIGP